MYVSEIITTVKDVIVALAAVSTVFIGARGLKTWKRELKGKMEFETAIGLIKATYKLRDELRFSRSPITWGHEKPEEYQIKKDHSPQEEAEAQAYVFKNRWNPIYEAKQLFDAAALEAEALWGNEIKDKTNTLNQCINKLNAAMQAIVNDRANAGEDFKVDREFGIKMRSTAFITDEKNNKFTQEITAAVKAIEDFALPHLRRS